MAEDNASERVGFSTRRVETVRYRVLQELPRPDLPAVGVVFEAWPWGESFASLKGYGPIAKNHEIADWEKAELIAREPAKGERGDGG